MLSSTIYFFHDFSELKLGTDTNPVKDAHHVVSNNFFSMNEINISKKIKKIARIFIQSETPLVPNKAAKLQEDLSNTTPTHVPI